MIDLHINYLYEDVFVSYNENILDIDLNNISDDELIKYNNYIEKYCSSDANNNFFFLANQLQINLKRFYNINNVALNN